jgi:hypothetical protein
MSDDDLAWKAAPSCPRDLVPKQLEVDGGSVRRARPGWGLVSVTI